MNQYNNEKITRILLKQEKEIAKLKEQFHKLKLNVMKNRDRKDLCHTMPSKFNSFGRSPRQIWNSLTKNFFQ